MRKQLISVLILFFVSSSLFSAGGRVVRDVWNRDVEIPSVVTSIVALGSMGPRMASYLGVVDMLVGAEDLDINGMSARYDYSPVYHDELEKLRNHGYRMAIVTNKPAAIARRLVAQFNLIHYFETVIGAGDVATVKPAPEMLIEAAHRMGVSIRDCVMIGDSQNDSLAAKNAGIRAVLVKTGYNEGVVIDQWAKEHAPDGNVFDTMTELSEFLIQNERRI